MQLLKKQKYAVSETVWYLSLVSFLNDIASEMLYPVLPIFLTQILGAPVSVVGLIEGIAEGSASFLKTFFGYWSDKIQKRKPFIVFGYSASAISKIIISLAGSWPAVLVGRFIDRLGKGARTGARDALLLAESNDSNKGFIFGFHRAMDTAGAIVGPLIALLLIHANNNNLRIVLYVASIPTFFSLIFFVFIKEKKSIRENSKPLFSFSLHAIPREVKIFLLGIALFSLGNSTDAFLILKAQSAGMTLTSIILAYVLYNTIYSLASTPAGIISDKIGYKKVFNFGIIIFSVVYLGFAFVTHSFFVWILFALYGIYSALTDGIAKALVGSYIEEKDSGKVYGLLGGVTGICTIFASIIGGFLWSTFSSQATFVFGAILALLSFFVFRSIRPLA